MDTSFTTRRQHQTTGGAVEAMHQIYRGAELAAQLIKQVDIDIGGDAAGMCQQSRRLGHDQQLFVDMQQRQRRGVAHIAVARW